VSREGGGGEAWSDGREGWLGEVMRQKIEEGLGRARKV